MTTSCEYFATLLSELGAWILETVALQPEGARSDDIRGKPGTEILNLHITLLHFGLLHRLVHGIAQAKTHVHDHLRHLLNLSGGENGRQLVPHRSPLLALEGEQVAREGIVSGIGESATILEVAEVLDHHLLDEI